MKSVEIVKIINLIPIYKEWEEANSIQVARIKTSDDIELQYNIIVGKNLYSIGDSAIYIQPDYCIPNTPIFREYHEPGGDASKSKLGKKGRIRAIKFNFHFKDQIGPIYSNGILIPISGAKDIDLNGDLEEIFGIIKYVADDSLECGNNSGMQKGSLPSFLYSTDEIRIELYKKTIDECYQEKETLSGSTKRDGSSVTIYCKKDLSGEYQVGICSRKFEKKLDQTYVSAFKSDDIFLHKYYDKDTNRKGWYDDISQKFYTDEEAITAGFEEIKSVQKDAWVDTVNKYNYLDKLLEYCKKYELELALRGELIGQGNKGSGNKLNADAKLEQQIIWFGVDDLSSGFATRIHYGQVHNLKHICTNLNAPYTEEIFNGVYSYDELISKCNSIFTEIKEKTGQIIEGVVIRSKFNNKLSCKYINPEYDSKS